MSWLNLVAEPAVVLGAFLAFTKLDSFIFVGPVRGQRQAATSYGL
jgi:hypothetical protein